MCAREFLDLPFASYWSLENSSPAVTAFLNAPRENGGIKNSAGKMKASGKNTGIIFDRIILEELYHKLNRRKFVHPDPLEFLYGYPDVEDREIVALIASSLAYGRVVQILRSVKRVLTLIEEPRRFVESESFGTMEKKFRNFKHRFTSGKDIAMLLHGVKGVISRYGSLEKCFLSGFSENDETICPALKSFVDEIKKGYGGKSCILADPALGSACKRLNLFLRWMVRKDDVDPGGWDNVPASKLLIPLDTHMHNISIRLGITRRKQANMVTALEITGAFRKICPDDPVRYDFCLTRYGIRSELSTDIFGGRPGKCPP